MGKRFYLYGALLAFVPGLLGYFVLGPLVAHKVQDNQRKWAEFEASHGGCWATGGYDTYHSMMPVYGVDGNGNPYIVTWMDNTTYNYHWSCHDGTTYTR